MVWDGSANGGFTTGKPWLPIKAPQLSRNVEAQAQDPDTVVNFYRRMLAFRRETPALRHGKTRFLDLPDPVLGFMRGDGMACLFNLSPKQVTLKLTGLDALIGPSLDANLAEETLTLGSNGVAFATMTAGPL
jgi:alpha-glucosidase